MTEQNRPTVGQRLSRPVVRWIGGTVSAVVVALVSGVILAYVAPGGAEPGTNTGDTGALGKPTATSSGTREASDKPPFTLTEVARPEICTPFIVSGQTADIAVPEFDPGTGIDGGLTDQQVIDWAKRVNAVPAYHKIVLTLQGASANAVILQGIDVVVVKRGPRLKPDAVYQVESGCGAGLSPRYFSVDLDGSKPALIAQPGSDEAGNTIPAVTFPFTVSNADPEMFIVSALPKTCDCTWYLRLRWLSEGKSGTTVIDNGGQPFHTAAMDDDAAKKHYYAPRGNPCDSISGTKVGAWCDVNW